MPGRSALASVTPSPAVSRQPGSRSGRPGPATATAASGGTRTGGTAANTAARKAVAAQRRGYAAAVVRGLARSHRGRTVAEIEAVLRASLPPLGVRLSVAARRELALAIAHGRPAALP